MDKVNKSIKRNKFPPSESDHNPHSHNPHSSNDNRILSAGNISDNSDDEFLSSDTITNIRNTKKNKQKFLAINNNHDDDSDNDVNKLDNNYNNNDDDDDDDYNEERLDFNTNNKEKTKEELDKDKDSKAFEDKDYEEIAANSFKERTGMDLENDEEDEENSNKTFSNRSNNNNNNNNNNNKRTKTHEFRPVVVRSRHSKSHPNSHEEVSSIIEKESDSARRARLFAMFESSKADEKLEPFKFEDSARISDSYKAADFDVQDNGENNTQITSNNEGKLQIQYSEAGDEWLNEIQIDNSKSDGKTIKLTRKSNVNTVYEKSAFSNSVFDKVAGFQILLKYMKQGELVKQTMKRLGDKLQNSLNKPHQPRQKNVRKQSQINKHNDTELHCNNNYEIKSDNLDRLVFNEFCDVVQTLLLVGNILDIYDQTKEQIEFAYNNDIPPNPSTIVENSNNNNMTVVNKDEEMWEYKLSIESTDIYGPFSISQMYEWFQSNYLSDPAIVCREIDTKRWIKPNIELFTTEQNPDIMSPNSEEPSTKKFKLRP